MTEASWHPPQTPNLIRLEAKRERAFWIRTVIHTPRILGRPPGTMGTVGTVGTVHGGWTVGMPSQLTSPTQSTSPHRPTGFVVRFTRRWARASAV